MSDMPSVDTVLSLADRIKAWRESDDMNWMTVIDLLIEAEEQLRSIGNRITCAFCGHITERSDEDPLERIRSHMLECKQHPLSHLMRGMCEQMDRARTAIRINLNTEALRLIDEMVAPDITSAIKLEAEARMRLAEAEEETKRVRTIAERAIEVIEPAMPEIAYQLTRELARGE